MIVTPPSDMNALNRTIGRYKNQGVPIWMIDPRDALTDIRAIMGGSVTHLGRDGNRLNPLHPCILQHGEADAAELARLLKILARPSHEISALYLQTPIHEFLTSHLDGDVFTGSTLKDLCAHLTAQGGPCAQLVSDLHARLQQFPEIETLIGGPTQMNRGAVKQFSYTPVTQAAHEAVTLTLARLAGIGARRTNTSMVMISLTSPLDTPELAAAVWAQQRGSAVTHIRH